MTGMTHKELVMNIHTTSDGFARGIGDKEAIQLLVEGEDVSRNNEGREQTLVDFAYSWLVDHGDEDVYFAHEHTENFLEHYEVPRVREGDYDILWEYFSQYDNQ